MNREECENHILEKLKEIKDIAKEYDKSRDFYLSVDIRNKLIDINNRCWETAAPLCVTLFDDGGKIHYDN